MQSIHNTPNVWGVFEKTLFYLRFNDPLFGRQDVDSDVKSVIFKRYQLESIYRKILSGKKIFAAFDHLERDHILQLVDDDDEEEGDSDDQVGEWFHLSMMLVVLMMR